MARLLKWEVAPAGWLSHLTVLSSRFRLVTSVRPFVSGKTESVGLAVEEGNPQAPVTVSFLRRVVVEAVLEGGIL